jgi:hypothetical protein
LGRVHRRVKALVTLIAAQPNHPDAALGAARRPDEAEGN